MKQILILLISVILFSCSNGDKRYHISETENKASEENPLIFHNDKLCNGIIYNTYENGQLKEEGKYQYGNKIGEHKSWYENGELKTLDILIDGKKNGICRVWYENGQLMFEGNYINNLKDGIHKDWDKDGELKFEKPYNNGKIDGLYKYYEDGKLDLVAKFKNGEVVDIIQ